MTIDISAILTRFFCGQVAAQGAQAGTVRDCVAGLGSSGDDDASVPPQVVALKTSHIVLGRSPLLAFTRGGVLRTNPRGPVLDRNVLCGT